MIIRQIPVGSMQNFTYIIHDEETKKCVIVDPSWDLDTVLGEIKRLDLSPVYIINTHGHFDHTTGNAEAAAATGAKVIQHAESELECDMRVNDGDVISFGQSSLQVVHTPGHSRDSICLYGDGKILTGDTLFVGNCGRVDLPGGSAADLYESLFGILYKMDGSLAVYPGHDYGPSPTSTLDEQKRTNPVLQRRDKAEFVSMMGQ